MKYAMTPQLLTLATLLIFSIVGRGQASSGNTSTLCAKPCECREDLSYTLVDCRNNEIQKFPALREWPAGVHTMDLSENRIEVLDAGLNQTGSELRSLKVLKLSRNNLRQIGPLQLNLLAPQLEVLDLSYNHLNDLNDLAFHGMESLRVLNLSDNELKFIPNTAFATLKGLREVVLSNNDFRTVSNDLLRPLSRLQMLALSNIGAHHLNGDVFNNLDELINLDLSRNIFDEVPIDALRSARFLESLDLSGNKIMELNDRSFRGLDRLRFLTLEEMSDLSVIKKDAFYPLKQLTVLKVKNCPQLSIIDPHAFEKLFEDPHRINLEEVDLSNNALKIVDPKLLAWDSIKYVNLQNNHWDCNCEMGWILNVTFNKLLTGALTCYQPSELEGKNMLDLALDQYQCQMMTWADLDAEAHHQRKVVQALSLMIGVMGMFLLGLLLVVYLKRRQLKQWWFYKRRRDGAIYYVRANTSPVPIEKADMYSNNMVD